MSCLQVLLCIIFPPLAVLDRGCGSILIVTILTCCAWVPGVLAALIILNYCCPVNFETAHFMYPHPR
jgi:uncharacterized membrane protein YqaE (UPF0057 family)